MLFSVSMRLNAATGLCLNNLSFHYHMAARKGIGVLL